MATSGQLAEIERLETELEDLLNDPSVAELKSENAKLAYQINTLHRAINQEKANYVPPKVMISQSIFDTLKSIFTVAMASAFPDLFTPEAKLQPVQEKMAKFGDYMCVSTMDIAKLLKESGINEKPRDIAQKICDNLPANNIIASTNIAGPGFINMMINEEYLKKQISSIYVNDVQVDKTDRPLRVLVDYSSPNIAKEMHVGHLRSTIIGDSIANLFESFGHKVLRVNHVGDWGTQFGMLIAHLIDLFPDYDKNCPKISDLQKFYKESKKRFDDDEEFKKRAYDNVVKLQSHEPAIHRAWQAICEASRNEFKKVYDRLNIVGLEEIGESFYQDKMDSIVASLKNDGLLVFDDGRYIMWAPGVEIPLTVVKTGGGYTYDTSDLAALHYRVNEVKADTVIYVTDNGQELHFRQVFAAAQKANFYDPVKTRIEHAGFGVVLGEDKKKFKTRSGETVRLVDLLDEGIQRSRGLLVERGRDKELTADELKKAEEAVAYGCIKYSDLQSNRKNDYVFSFDKMLDMKGNTAAYLLYQLTRIRSVVRKVGDRVTSDDLQKVADALNYKFDHPNERKLAKAILKYHEILYQASRDLLIHRICEWMYELSKCFSEFYDKCYVIEKMEDGANGQKEVIHYGRLLLAESTARVMEAAFKILGISTLEKM